MMWYLILGVLSLGCGVCQAQADEFCENESFTAMCPANEMVVIDTALYGRMRNGRCVTGEIGCSQNVEEQLDRWCSGRRECDILVTSLLHDGITPCGINFRSYLQANYSCVPVIQAPADGCYGKRPIQVTASSGYLSSLVTRDSDCGSIDNPWLLEVPAGQRINITLLDFAMYSSSKFRDPAIDDNVCMVYAVIKETAGPRSETICGGKRRESHVFTSTGRTVEVRLVGNRKNEDEEKEPQFLLKFDAIGCPELEDPKGGHVTHSDPDKVVISCHDNDQQWTLRCEDKQWIGNVGECPYDADNDGKAAKSMFPSGGIPNGLSIVIVVGIALVVGLGILLVGLLCLRRQRMRAAHHPYATADKPLPNNNDPHPYDVSKIPRPTPEYFGPNGENDYYRTWQLQQRARGGGAMLPPGECMEHVVGSSQHQHPPQTYRTLSTDSSFSTQNGRYSEHLYESPKFDRHDFPLEEGGHVKYFELDPEVGVASARMAQQPRDVTSASFVVKHDVTKTPKR